jgi:hypothetical protein
MYGMPNLGSVADDISPALESVRGANASFEAQHPNISISNSVGK